MHILCIMYICHCGLLYGMIKECISCLYLSDIDLISADEYLDLRNMNYYIKTNDENPYYVNPDSLLNV